MKALANPPKIFFVPYRIAVLNFAVQFMVWVVFLLVEVVVRGPKVVYANPLYVLITVFLVHSALIGISKREPQLANIIQSKISLFKKKIPRIMKI